MSDEREQVGDSVLRGILQHKLEKVTPELLSEFLYVKGIPVVRCLMCGSEDMGIPQTTVHSGTEFAATYVVPVKIDIDSAPFSLVKYEYRIICKNCGYVSYFATWPVMKWIEERSVKGGANEH